MIEARATDIAEFVQQEIKDSGYAGKLAYGIVLTGGSAKLKDLDELFRRVQASQFVASHDDQVCPAKWRPGAETLKPSLDLVGLL